MSGTWVQWLAGLAFSVLGGLPFVWLFLKILRIRMGLDSKPGSSPRTQAVPSSLTGVVERLFFTFLVAFNVSGAGIAMVA